MANIRILELDRDIALLNAAGAEIEARRAIKDGLPVWAATMQKNAAVWRGKAADASDRIVSLSTGG